MHYIAIKRDILLEINEQQEENLYNQRLNIEINGSVRWQAGCVALGNNMAYITVSQARMRQLNIEKEDEIEVVVSKDTSEFGMEVPEELLAIFAADSLYKTSFDQLPKGTQRYIIYYILQVKSSQKREERALLMMNNLVNNREKKINFRILLGKE